MFKRIAAVLSAALVALPMMANAAISVWQLTTKLNNTGGTIQQGSYAAQTTTTALIKYYYPADAVPVTITANAGYKISAIAVNGVAQAMPVASPKSYTMGLANYPTAAAQTVTASFTVLQSTVSASTDGGGSVTPGSALVNYGGSKAFVFTPATGNKLIGLTGVPAGVGVAYSPALGSTGPITVTLSNITSDFAVKGSFLAVKADAGYPQTVLLGSSATLDSSATVPLAGTTYAWSQVSGPALGSPWTSTDAAPVINPTAVGAYKFKLVATNGSATSTAYTTVNVTTSAAEAARAQCYDCHVANKLKPNFDAWSTSRHEKNLVMCSGCHIGAATGAHPGSLGSVVTKGVNSVCSNCHSQVAEYQASRHNTSATGNAVPDIINHGTNCTQTCHFQNKASAGCQSCHGGTLNADGTFRNASTHVYRDATAANTCMVCHEGGRHGLPTYNWEVSSHNNGFHPATCVECHNPHNTDAVASDGKTDSCGTCHKYYGPAANYSIYTDGTYTVMSAPHGGGAYQATATGTAKTQFVTQGLICTDCHGHDNTINAGYAESGHGAVSQDALNAWNHYDWSARTNNGTRQNGNCDRCHTNGGFVKLLGDTTVATRLAPVTGQPQAVLACIACHAAPAYSDGSFPYGMGGTGGALLPEGKLRIDATPAGSAAGALKNGYFALFSSATGGTSQGNVAANKTKIEIAFPGYKNSSICIPCHSGRSTAAVFVAVIDQAKALNKNYTTISTSYYQHAANMGQTFISQGGYDLSGSLAAIQSNGPSAHAAVKMGASDISGPCAGCHYSVEGATHSLEVEATSPTCIASACHATAPDLVNAKANFDAGVQVLDALIRDKFAPLQTVAGDLATERANVRFGRFGKAAGVAATDATAKAAYGAWYNWQILATYDNAAWAHNPRYARQLLFDTIAYVANGTGTMPSGSTARNLVAATLANTSYNGNSATVATNAQAFITSPGCQACHADKVTAYTTSGAYHYVSKSYACANCHTELHMNTNPATQPTCRCHGDSSNGGATPVLDALHTGSCTPCHGSSDGHTMKSATQFAEVESNKGCIDCHADALTHIGGFVADNNGGVRAIMPEFNKRSHHITGGTPTNAQCIVCHLEGQVVSGKVVMNPTYHMKDAKIYLRNADDNTPFVWSGTEHTAMDNFCFSCHDSNGANGLPTELNTLTGGNASNPFGDTLTNSYDQVARAGVVDVKTAFTTTNASHHAVSGKRYQHRFSNATNAAAWAARNPSIAADYDTANTADGSTVDGNTVSFDGHYDPAGAHEGGEATLFEADKFVYTYVPLGAAESVGDDSTLHCGDCHTVGQWAVGTSTNADGSTTSVAIGAHGSANDYLLRNSLGTDALHSSQTYVCFNCHKGGQLEPYATEGQVAVLDDTLWADLIAEGAFASTKAKPTWNVGWGKAHPNVIAGQVSGYATAHAVSAFHAQCQADSSAQVGSAGTPAAPVKSRVWYTTGGGHKDRIFDFLPAANATAAVPTAASEGGNITGIACTNCHNSGLRQGWGGIHGGNNTYTDGLGRAQTTYRFMPGMGNYRYAPPGGWDGKDVSDSRFVIQANGTDPTLPANKMAGKPIGGCYTNSSTDANNGWSSCAHHGTSTVPVYGGGTSTNANTSTSPTWEPTVREATAGNSLVTRPVKY